MELKIQTIEMYVRHTLVCVPKRAGRCKYEETSVLGMGDDCLPFYDVVYRL